MSSSSSSSHHHHNFFFDLNTHHRNNRRSTSFLNVLFISMSFLFIKDQRPAPPNNNPNLEEVGSVNLNNISNSNVDSDEPFEIKFTDTHFQQWYIETLLNVSCISFAGALICAGLLWHTSYFFVLMELATFDFLNITVLYRKWRTEKKYFFSFFQ